MIINNFLPHNINNDLKNMTIPSEKASDGGDTSFSDIMKNSINELDSYQSKSDKSIESFIKGEETEIHNVMLAMEEAKMSMQFAIEVRNRLLEVYQEFNKIQI